MIITRVELKREGLAAGSRTVAEDWNDWNRLVMSLESAKLLRNKTYETVSDRIKTTRCVCHVPDLRWLY